MNDKPPAASFLETTALNPESRADPYPKLRSLQERCPVFYDEGTMAWTVLRHGDVRAVVNDRTLWRHPKMAEQGSLTQAQLAFVDELDLVYKQAESILFLDDPDHARIRTPLAKALYARVAKMKPEIDAIVSQTLDRLEGRASFDLMAEFALPIPILVIARILGMDEDRVGEFRAWSEAAILSLTPLRSDEDTRRMVWGSNSIAKYFFELMAARRAEPKDDLVSDMVTLGADISEAELNVNLSGLLIGGNLTTTDLIGNGVWLLLTHPQELAKLKADAGLAAAAVEEILRFESPVDATGRVISGEREMGGCQMHARQTVFASLRAANRDPKVFEDPDRFDITRRHAPHVAFGGGAHICIGAPLARAEAQAALIQLFRRFPELRLAEQELEWRMLPLFRGLQKLIVET
jgi:cytochrome P450